MNTETLHFKFLKVFCCVLLLQLGWSHALGAVTEANQTRQIQGVITDSQGETLPGVNVIVKGTSIGAISDLDGKFTLQVPSPKSVLVISYVGYETYEVIVGNKTSFNIVLEDQMNALDEVVVVAYGSQKKQTVTGAVSMMKSSELVAAPVANVTNALVGKLPGVITQQPGGRPGEDAATILIRGKSTFNDASPLIIIDGVEQESFSQLDANEIESLSVLKDASSTAVYGIRGANGVILITTKRGKEGKPKISVTANWGLQRPTQIPEFLGSYEHLLLRKKAWENDGKDPLQQDNGLLTDESLEGFRLGQDPYRYPDVNWYDEMVNKSGSLQQQYNINISGGTKVVRYFISLGYLNQGGMFKYGDLQKDYNPEVYYRRFNFRSNIDLNINKYQTVSANISGRSGEMNGFSGASGSFFQGLIAKEPWRHPIYNPDGTIAGVEGSGNPLSTIAYSGYENSKTNYYDLVGTLHNDLSFITEGLSFDMSISFNNNFGSTKVYTDGIDTYYYEPNSGRYDQLGEDSPFRFKEDKKTNPMRRTNLQLKVGYARRFGKHNINSILVYNQQKTTSGNSIPSALMGYAARVEYGFAEKYLGEVSLGYNGSENFAKGHRFGFFPSGSLGYVISEEPFMAKVKNVIPFLKVRGSIGLVGNDKSKDRFLYMGEYAAQGIYAGGGTPSFGFGTTNPSTNGGIYEKRNENKLLTWETALKGNIGLEARLFSNDLLTFTADFFKEHRKDILLQGRSTPQIIGLSSPYLNVGEVKNWGYEFELSHRHHIGKVDYYIRANYSFARNVVINYDDPAGTPDYQKIAGFRIDQFKGYQVLGFFQNEEEIKHSPDQTTLGGPIIPGDLKYWDRNGDGTLTEADKVAIGYSRIPEIMYSVTPGIIWKGLEISAQFQGAAHASVLFAGNAGYEFGGGAGGGQVSKIHQDYWTPENPNASYPSLHMATKHSNKNINSLHLKSAAYLRLKNVQITYSFPASIYRKLGMTGLKVYLNGTNLYTWSKIDNFDPETVNASGEVYPQQSVYNLGVNINF